MNKLLMFLGLAIVSWNVHAQTPRLAWVKNLGTSSQTTSGIEIRVDSNKAVVVTGQFYSTTDFDAGAGTFNLTATGASDVFITKYDTSGAFIWAKKIGGSQADFVRTIKFDNNGNILLLGHFQGIVDVDPGPGVHNTSGSESVLVKLDNNGNFIWAKHFLLSGIYNLDIDMAGNILLSGYFAGTKDFDPGPGTYMATSANQYEDFFIVKLDNAGNFTWMRQLNNQSNSYAHQDFGLESDANNNIYFAGHFGGGYDFDPGPAVFSMTPVGGLDAFVMKLTPQGDFAWAKQWGAGGNDMINGLEVDAAGNVFTTGQFYNTVDFDPGAGSFPLTGSTSRSCFISKLDNQGNLVFAKCFTGQAFGQSITLDASDNIYVSGGFYNTVDFDPGPGVYNLSNGHLFNAKLFPDGSFGWAAGFITQMGAFESIYSSIAVDIFKNVYYTGSFPFQVDFDPSPANHIVTAQGMWDAPIVKLSQCQSINNISATFCTSYTLNNITYTDTGTFYQVLPTGTDCDSIIVLHLTRQYKFSQLTASACNSYLWNGLTLTASGIYRDTIDLSNDCDSIVELNLTVHPLPQPVLGSDTSICGNASLILNPGNFSNYSWSNGSTASSVTISSPGTYWVQVTDNNSCSANDTINIGARPPGNPIDLGADKEQCGNNTVILNARSGYVSYLWQDGSTDSIFNATATGTYYVQANDSCGNTFRDTIRINMHQSPAINLGNDTSFCAGQSIQLNAGNGFSAYLWNTSATTQNISVNTAGTYSIIATTSQGCQSFDTLRVITVYPNPQVTLNGNNELCAGTVRILDPGAFVSYLWQDGSTNRTFNATGIGNYSVSVRDNNGCTGTGSISITTIVPLATAFLPRDTLLCSYSNLELAPLQNFNEYLWSNNSRTRSITINDAGLYWLQVTDDKGCTGKDSILVEPKECRRGLFVPNAFTPDNNRINDEFKALLYGPVKFFEFTVYNRWGQMVFKTTDRFKGWNGNFKGTKQDSNVFVWICRYQFEGEEMKVSKGTVVLVR